MRCKYVYAILAIALCQGVNATAEQIDGPADGGPDLQLPGLAAESPLKWRLQPRGKSWADFFTPADQEVFMDFGNNVAISLTGVSRADFFLFLNMRSQAGYQYSNNPSAPQTPVDLLHQTWQQALGFSLDGRIPLHAFVMRDCNHQLDKGGFDPVVWTDFVVGAGTLAPFRESAYRLWTKGQAPRVFWFLGGGPAIRAGRTSIWSSNSPLRAEGWGRALVRHAIASTVAFDIYGEGGMQYTDTSPELRHHLRTEAGVMLHAGAGGWRLFAGRLWRDTRFLWPYDQRNYAGLEFIF